MSTTTAICSLQPTITEHNTTRRTSVAILFGLMMLMLGACGTDTPTETDVADATTFAPAVADDQPAEPAADVPDPEEPAPADEPIETATATPVPDPGGPAPAEEPVETATATPVPDPGGPAPAEEPVETATATPVPGGDEPVVADEPIADDSDVALLGALAQAIEAGTDSGQLSAEESTCAAEGFIDEVGTDFFTDNGITSETMPAFADIPSMDENGMVFFDAVLECIGATEVFVRDLSNQLGADGARCVADEVGDELVAAFVEAARGVPMDDATTALFQAAAETCDVA